ncbi:RNA polymerase sigma factor [Aquimarina litoralis]|uniref:RNA polymerase sigma factor n=1 Tax=Aquimarina litoralis TaxID=584605 RepID=UPI001C580196|nr:RNA polymerase sigma factor [Aquimarina litoralis]MBW1299020.1 sigma-70 family RNA polymerase sigma factor [Aquimarina litoralis]
MRNENEIIQAIANGDEKALAILYNLYSEKIYNTALSYSKVPEDAEEITQDVFFKIFKNISKFKQESSLNTWVYRITINTSLNYLKKKKRFSLFNNSSNKSQVINFQHPGVLLEKKEKAAILYQAIDCLSKNQKTAFILSYIEELPRQEVADIMETSLKAVESLLQRAKRNIRSELEKIYPNHRKSKK